MDEKQYNMGPLKQIPGERDQAVLIIHGIVKVLTVSDQVNVRVTCQFKSVS